MLARDIGAEPLEGSPTGRAEGLEEGDIDLHRRGELGRRVKDAAREALDPFGVSRQAVGQGIGVRIDAQAQRRPKRSLARTQPLERRTAHPVVTPAGAAMATGWSEAAWAALRRSASGLSELAA